MNEPCKRLCIDDLCRGGSPLCGQDFCIGCGDAICFDETLCGDCANRFHEDLEDRDEWGAS